MGPKELLNKYWPTNQNLKIDGSEFERGYFKINVRGGVKWIFFSFWDVYAPIYI